MKVLNLTLKKKWFDMIISGEKKEEYRELKSYWVKRLKIQVGYKHYDIVRFKNGYGKNSPVIDVECLGIRQNKAKPEWSDNAKGYFFVIDLGEVFEPKEGK